MKLKLPSNVLVNAYRSMLHAASTDQTRVHLNSVWLRALPNHPPFAWATNGHWLAAVKLDAPPATEEMHVGITAQCVKTLLTVAPKRPMGAAIEVKGSFAEFTFDNNDRFSFKAVDATPPPIHVLIPDRASTKKHSRAAIGIDVLEPALKSLRALTKGKNRFSSRAGVALYAMGPSALDPLLIWSANVPEWHAMLMPFRMETSARRKGMRWWHEAMATIVHAGKKKATKVNPTEPVSAAAQ